MTTHEDGPYCIEPDGRRLFMAKAFTKAADDETVIYLNGDPLDNRRANLRVVKTASLAHVPDAAGRH